MRTKVCDILGIKVPVVLAPTGGISDARLVAAVSEAGGLGLLAGTWTAKPELQKQIREIRGRTAQPFGVNFVLHLADPEAISLCLAEGVPVLSSFRGDPAKVIAQAHAAGAVALHQATNLAEVTNAVRAAVDVVIVQGNEAGGHCGPEPLWSFLPDAVLAAGTVPVLAAGGIVDGRGLAAALALGASGVVIGTRFIASPDSPASPAYKAALLAARPGDTLYTGVWDQVRGEDWPGVKVRALRNPAVERWHGKPAELAAGQIKALADLELAETRDDAAGMALLMGVGAGRINTLVPAADIIAGLVAEAKRVLEGLAALPRS